MSKLMTAILITIIICVPLYVVRAGKPTPQPYPQPGAGMDAQAYPPPVPTYQPQGYPEFTDDDPRWGIPYLWGSFRIAGIAR